MRQANSVCNGNIIITDPQRLSNTWKNHNKDLFNGHTITHLENGKRHLTTITYLFIYIYNTGHIYVNWLESVLSVP